MAAIKSFAMVRLPKENKNIIAKSVVHIEPLEQHSTILKQIESKFLIRIKKEAVCAV